MTIVICELTAQLQAGDEVAWARFHQEYSARLLRYLLVVNGGQEEAAKEALQLTWVRCARHIRRFSSEAALWSWLTVLARSSLVDERRKRGRFLQFLDRWRMLRAAEESAVGESDGNADAKLLQLVQIELSYLLPEEKRLVQGKYLENLSCRQLAELWGASEKAIESRLARLRNRIKSAVLVRLQKEHSDERE